MKKTILLPVVFLVAFSQNAVFAQPAKHVELNNTEVHTLTSKYVKGMQYNIDVILPPGYATSGDQTYPVLFYLDAYMSTGTFSNASFGLAASGLIKPVILVGIDFTGGLQEFLYNRARDYTPTYVPPDSLGPAGARMVPTSGGAAAFLQFIQRELIPYVEATYRTDHNDLGLLGYSLGGLFVTWVLQTSPGLFHRYGICSPSLLWDHFKVLNALEKQSLGQKTTIFVSIAEMENPVAQSNVKRLLGFLQKQPGVHLESAVFAGEDHHSGFGAAYIRALRELYAKQ